MTNAERAKKAIAKAGGTRPMARLLRIPASTVNNWRTRGVPADMAYAVAVAAGCSEAFLRPDVFRARQKPQP